MPQHIYMEQGEESTAHGAVSTEPRSTYFCRKFFQKITRSNDKIHRMTIMICHGKLQVKWLILRSDIHRLSLIPLVMDMIPLNSGKGSCY